MKGYKKRKRLTRKKSRKIFTKASGVHHKNSMNTMPMRGGIRL